MDEISNNIIKLPEDALPSIESLNGDLRMLAGIIGVAKALDVAQMFNGTPIRLYGVNKWLLRHRDRCIRRDSVNMSGVELARKYGVSERRIWQILGEAETDERQMGLWG